MRCSIAMTWVLLFTNSAFEVALADGVEWRSEAASSELAFSAWYEGGELPGVFKDFEVLVELDEPDTGPRTLVVEVEVGSVDMKDREVNAELSESDWFDAASFPVAVFTSRDVRPAGSGFLAVGHLRLKGIEKPLEVPLEWRRDGDSASLTGSITLSRQHCRVGTGEWASDASLADRVELLFRVALAPER